LAEQSRALIIDDEDSIRDACRQVLQRMECRVDETGYARRGLEMALKDPYDLILLDVKMPQISGLDILKQLKGESGVSARVIIVTGYGTIEMAVEAMRHGAFDFLAKPFSAAELRRAAASALKTPEKALPEGDIAELIGDSDYMLKLKDTIRRVAHTDSTVLITGESGTGKELVARAIQRLSVRGEEPFIPVDCSSLVENLMESELFGHVKGSFSGAEQSREGRFQMADGGTLFLDEISNLSLATQAKLLRVIQEGEVPRVGSSKVDRVDVRLIAATNRDLRALVTSGRFREDLFYRISVVPIELQPLRGHPSDILPIAQHYLDLYTKKHKGREGQFSREAQQSLTAYTWPGNVREVKNTMERLSVLCDKETVDLSDIFYYGQETGAQVPVGDVHTGRMTLVDVEKEHITRALKHFDYRIGKTADFLGIDRKTLRSKIRNYGIDPDE